MMKQKTGKPNRSQHKTEERECPVCRQVKSFPTRNETCSQRCAAILLSARSAQEKPETGEQHDISGNSWNVSIPRTRIHTLEQLLEYCEGLRRSNCYQR